MEYAKEKANKMYSERLKAIKAELKRIEEQIDAHEKNYTNNHQGDYGFVGDLGHTLEILKEIKL